MSLDDPTPTEYFGPHAKRWINPDTGVTLSLSPRDYYREVAKEQLQREKEVQERLREEKLRGPLYIDNLTIEDATPEKVERALADEGWPNVISMDTMRDRDLQPEAGLFKEEGVLIAPLSSWNPPEHQRYDLNAFAADEERGDPMQRADGLPTFAIRGGIKYPTPAEMVAEAQAAAETARAAARSAEASRDKALANAGLPPITGAKISSAHLEISADGIKPLTVEGANLLERGKIRYLSLSEDDSLGIIRPVEQKVPGKPAARHFRRRKIGRNTLRLGLLYIIAVIGVISVADVIF